MQNVVADLKEKLEEGSVESYSWLSTQDMVADALTKEVRDTYSLQCVVLENIFNKAQSSDNLVRHENGEIKISNKTS